MPHPEADRTASGLLEIGVVSKPHGIRGEVHVHPHNPGSVAFDKLESALVRRPAAAGEPAPHALRLAILGARPTPDGSWLVQFRDVHTRNDAETLRGATVTVRRSELPEPAADEFYVGDLEGLEAVAPDGAPLGRIREVYPNGAQEVLVVETPRGVVEVPFVEAHVGEVDLERGRLVILDLGALIPEP
jgi:16S rRNA processing protein RimM